jgi:hypothetical protein
MGEKGVKRGVKKGGDRGFFARRVLELDEEGKGIRFPLRRGYRNSNCGRGNPGDSFILPDSAKGRELPGWQFRDRVPGPEQSK